MVARVEEDSRRISLKICAVGGTQSLLMNEVCTVGELMLPEQSLDAREMAQRYEHFRDIPVMSYKASRPRILIGLSNLHAIAPIDAKLGRPGEPIAVESPLGWTIYGPSHGTESYNVHIVGHHDEIKRLKNAYTLRKALDYKPRKVEEEVEPVADCLKWRRYRKQISGEQNCGKLARGSNLDEYCISGEKVAQGVTLSVRSERYVSFPVNKQAWREQKITGNRNIEAKQDYRRSGSVIADGGVRPAEERTCRYGICWNRAKQGYRG